MSNQILLLHLFLINFFNNSEFCTLRSLVFFKFLICCNYWLSCDYFHFTHLVASANWLMWWANTIAKKILKSIFCNSVFKWMKSDYTHSATRLQSSCHIKQAVIQAIKFFINLNSYCLKNSFARISTLKSHSSRIRFFNYLCKLP